MKSYFTFLLLLICSLIFGQSENIETYSKVKIFVTGHTDLYQLANLGIPVDHGEYKEKTWFISDYSTKELNTIKKAGFQTEIIIKDVQKYYASQSNSLQQVNSSSSCSENVNNYTTPNDFTLGSMGGFFTYAEFIGHLDNMANKYPNLISIKAPIDTFKTHENRDIFWLKISDNPNVDEAEPEVMYSAIHHAREPAGLSQLIFYMYYLLENYATNPEIKSLVDNTEMYFIPMLNPDGYSRNESTNPNGGGLWRKNRRVNGDGTYGVDLNRNYGYQWGGQGASTNTSDETYRGPSGFSEPETQAIKWFCEQHNFQLALNYHTYSNLLLYPYGYDYNQPTPDHGLFQAITALMVQENGYADQISSDLYPAAGDSDDWMYGEQSSKNKILAMTPEVGSSFWPASSNIVGLCAENVFANITLARLAGKHAKVTEKGATITNNTNGYINYDLQRLGLDSTGTYTVSLTGISSNISSVSAPKVYSNLGLLTIVDDSIGYSLTNVVTGGDQIVFIISIDNGSYIVLDTIIKTYGLPIVIYAHDGNSFNNWTSGSWATTNSNFVSSPSSITDSPNGNYSNQSTTTIQLDTAINLSNVNYAQLNFWAKWEIETGFDYVQLSASTDLVNWTPLCGKYTVIGNTNQAFTEPVYDGFQTTWVKEEICLNDFIGQSIYLRFLLKTDNFSTEDGFFFDDLSVSIIPSAPSSVPEIEKTVTSISPNPASSYSYVNFSGNAKKLNIHNSIGELVQSIKLPGNTRTWKLNTSNFNNGIYYIELDGKKENQKLVIIH